MILLILVGFLKDEIFRRYPPHLAPLEPDRIIVCFARGGSGMVEFIEYLRRNGGGKIILV